MWLDCYQGVGLNKRRHTLSPVISTNIITSLYVGEREHMVCFSLNVSLLVCPCVSQDSDLEAMIRHMEDVLNGDSVGEYLL